MATNLSHSAPQGAIPKVENMRVAIVAAEWNAHITGALTDGALNVFKSQGLADEDVDVYHVPGAVELTFAASQLIEASMYDAIIVFGCVIRGGTPHYDYVCQSVTQGITALTYSNSLSDRSYYRFGVTGSWSDNEFTCSSTAKNIFLGCFNGKRNSLQNRRL